MKAGCIGLSCVVLGIFSVSLQGAWAGKPPNKPPQVTAFEVPSTASSPVPISSFTAVDSDGTVTGYLVTESATTPSPGDTAWSTTAPVEYATSSTGDVTLFAWARDNKNAVSASMNDTVTIAAAASKKVITVATSGGDFTDPVAAAKSITDADSSNPYLIKVLPGVYTVSEPVVLPSHVTLEGSGEENTEITTKAIPIQPLGRVLWCNTGCPDPFATLVLSGQSTARNIKISNYTDNSGIAVYFSGSVKADRVTAVAQGLGGKHPGGWGMDYAGFYGWGENSSAVLDHVTALAESVTWENGGDVAAILAMGGAKLSVTDSSATGKGGEWTEAIGITGSVEGIIRGSSATVDGINGNAIEASSATDIVDAMVKADCTGGCDGVYLGRIRHSEIRSNAIAVSASSIASSLLQGKVLADKVVNCWDENLTPIQNKP